MAYLEEFQTQINRRDFSKFLQLWEEYCTSDPVEIEELTKILEAIKGSELAKPFGQIVETGLPMWETITDRTDAYNIMKLLIDLETTNSAKLYDITLSLLKEKYAQDPQFNERLRLINMRTRENFQSALSNYDLLAHFAKGKFVFHAGGWGTGEIIDVSTLREQVSLEFEYVGGTKHLTFSNAFKVLTPLRDDHFLSRRFGDTDKFEEEAKADPIGAIKLLLQDLGPRTSSELKDELCELVIPEKDWTKWWQNARAKLKKDTRIESPNSPKDFFRLRKAEVSHEDRFLEIFSSKTLPNEMISTSYSFVRDFPSILKNNESKTLLHDKLLQLLKDGTLTDAQKLQTQIFLEEYLGHKFPENTTKECIQRDLDFEKIINDIEIAALKKRVLMLVRKHRQDWEEVFLKMLFLNQPANLRDYLFKELSLDQSELLQSKLKDLLKNPQIQPETFLWYFLLLIGKDQETHSPEAKEEIWKWFEGLLILFQTIEFKPEFRELTKKIHTLLSTKRYALIRQVLDGSSLAFVHEFLMLAAKIQTFTESEQKILQSLAAVVHPSISKETSKKNPHIDSQTIWTTEIGYNQTRERINQIGTTEIVANAREIEAARALGDLRENSEYKFALEKRSRLQGELKRLSDQLQHARIITKNDVSSEEVSVGSIVDVLDSKNQTVTYTILGPWDADPEKNILSLHSKFVQSMLGFKKGDKFIFRDEEYQIVSLKTIFD